MKRETASVLVTPSTTPVMDLTLFKTGLRIDNTDEDTYLDTLMGAATQQAEEYLQVALVRQLRQLRYTGIPTRDLKLDFGPVQRVVSIQYEDLEGNTQTLDSGLYVLRGDIVSPTFSSDWPAVTERYQNGFRVNYEAGIVDDTGSPTVGVVPDKVKLAIIMYGQIMYDKNPQVVETLNKAAERLLDTARAGMGV